MLLNIILTLFCVTQNVFGQIPYFGNCPQVKVVQDFDVEAYLGKWYEYEKYPFLFEIGGKCITAQYTMRPDGTVGVYNKQQNRM